MGNLQSVVKQRLCMLTLSENDSLEYTDIFSGKRVKTGTFLNQSRGRKSQFIVVEQNHYPMNTSHPTINIVHKNTAADIFNTKTGEHIDSVLESPASHAVSSIVLPNIGITLLEKFTHLWYFGHGSPDKDKPLSLSSDLAQICDQHSLILETSEKNGTLTIYGPVKYENIIHSRVCEVIQSMRNHFIKEFLTIPFSNGNIVIRSGNICESYNNLYLSEFTTLYIKTFSEDVELSSREVHSCLEGYSDIVIARYNHNGIWGIVSFTTAALADAACSKRKFEHFYLERPELKKESAKYLRCEDPPGRISVKVSLACKRHLQKSSYHAHCNMFQDLVIKTLEYYDFTDNVDYVITMDKSKTDTGYPLADIDFLDYDTARLGIRSLKYCKTWSKLRRRNIFTIENEEKISKQLSYFTLFLNPELHKFITVTDEKLSDMMSENFAIKWSEPLSECDELTGKVQCKFTSYFALTPSKYDISWMLYEKLHGISCQYLQSHLGKSFLQDLMAKTCTLITVDEVKRGSVHVYGQRKNRAIAIGLIDDIFQEKCGMYMIGEDQDDKWFPCQLDIRVKKDTINRTISKDGADDKKQEVLKCDVCYDTGTGSGTGSPYVMEVCGHVYCNDCLDMQFKVATTETMLPICCAICDRPISCRDLINICKHLEVGGQDYKMKVIKAATRDFLRRNVKDYFCCLKTNCDGLIREDGVPLSCPVCNSKICDLCHQLCHDGMTCDEFKDTTSAFQNWFSKDTENRKACPSCSMGIEKDGGCDTVKCTNCNVNICWHCLWYSREMPYEVLHECTLTTRL